MPTCRTEAAWLAGDRCQTRSMNDEGDWHLSLRLCGRMVVGGGSVLIINKEAEQRLHDKRARPVVMGSPGGIPRSGMQMTVWGSEFLGWNTKWVIGYRGTSELMLALERGEIDMTSTANLF